MISCSPASSPQLYMASNTPRAAWTGFRGVSCSFRKAILTDLQLSCYLEADVLKTWSEHVDFSQVRRLRLSGETTGSTLEYAATHCSFPLLEDLSIDLDRDDPRELQEDFSGHAVMFISSLTPLKKLTLSGSLEQEVFDSVLTHHGATLQQISLQPRKSIFSAIVKNNPFVFTKAHVEQLQRHCPLLEDLRMSIKRRKSNVIELRTYQIFSQFARLQVLFLQLDCSNPEVIQDRWNSRDPYSSLPMDPSFDEYYSQFSDTGMGISP